MNVLVADDDATTRLMLREALLRQGLAVLECAEGGSAWAALREASGPQLAVLDWEMPGLDGPSVCRRVREAGHLQPRYLILATVRDSRQDVVEGLDAGADDYLVKPIDADELRARIGVGCRVVELQQALARRVHELEEAQARVKQLQGLLPICSYCKRIRHDEDYWEQVEAYITRHTDAQFSHGICPECYERHVVPQLANYSKIRAGKT